MKPNKAGAVAGRYRMQIVRPDGSVRHDTGWFDNLITNVGLNRFGTGQCGNTCRVGSGSTAPDEDDQALQAQIAYTNSILTGSQGAQATAPYFGWMRRTWRFGTGVAAGNIAEVGIGWQDTGDTLFSRALILDALGDPTTITVLSDEVLDVSYELRIYPPEDDVSFDMDIEGETYACVLRPAGVNTTSWNPNLLDYGVAGSGGSMASVNSYAGPIGTTVQFPSGSGGGNGSTSLFAYANNSLERTARVSFSLDQGNIAGGIGAILMGSSNVGAFQVSFTPKIPKDATKVLTLDFGFSWDRYTP